MVGVVGVSPPSVASQVEPYTLKDGPHLTRPKLSFAGDTIAGHVFDHRAPHVAIRKKRKINRVSLKRQAVRAQPWLNYSFSSICFNWKE